MIKLLKSLGIITGMLTLIVAMAIGGIIWWDMPPASSREYFALANEWDTSHADRKMSSQDRQKFREQIAGRCLKLAEKYPESPAAIAALFSADAEAADMPEGQKALALLRPLIATTELKKLRQGMTGLGMGRTPVSPVRAAPLVLARIQESLDHPEAAQILDEIAVSLAHDSEKKQVPEHFAEVANLIVEQFADSPKIHGFCGVLGNGIQTPPWSGQFEKHLERILEVNQTPLVRMSAMMALATIAGASTERQEEARRKYQAFLDAFPDDKADPNINITSVLRHDAQTQLGAMLFASIGFPAPEIAGVDLSGRQMTLSEFRGKVVLLTFWATWCGPCMKLVRHERELATQYSGKPFVIVGINADDDATKAAKAVVDYQITWRSFKDRQEGEKILSNDWKCLGFPTIYLIDHKGIIRQRYTGAPQNELLDQTIQDLVQAASVK